MKKFILLLLLLPVFSQAQTVDEMLRGIKKEIAMIDTIFHDPIYNPPVIYYSDGNYYYRYSQSSPGWAFRAFVVAPLTYDLIINTKPAVYNPLINTFNYGQIRYLQKPGF